jgi:hypothetical protein
VVLVVVVVVVVVAVVAVVAVGQCIITDQQDTVQQSICILQFTG